MAQQRLLSSQGVGYAAVVIGSITILPLLAISLTLLTALIFAFSPILLATVVVLAAASIPIVLAVSTGFALWWLVPSFRHKIKPILRLVSEAWMGKLARVIGDIVREAGRRTIEKLPFSNAVISNVADVGRFLSPLTEAGRKLGGGWGFGAPVLQSIAKASGGKSLLTEAGRKLGAGWGFGTPLLQRVVKASGGKI